MVKKVIHLTKKFSMKIKKYICIHTKTRLGLQHISGFLWL